MKTMTSKVAAVTAGLAIAASMLTLAPMAQAASLTSSQISSILSLLSSFGANSATIANVDAALNGTSSTSGSTTTTTGNSSCSFSRSLTIGSTGADVTCLQNGLIGGGFSIPAGATGYFGTQTRAAVASWQSSRNVAPAVGYFGPISRAAWNLGGSSSSSSTTTTTTTTTTVAGCAAGALYSSTSGAACGTTTTTAALTGSGRLTNVTSANDTTSDLKEGDSATNVIGFSADAVGGDVAIQRVDVTFDIAAVGSANLDRYVSDVSLYLDGKKLASMDPALGDKTLRNWVLRFSGLNGVIKSGTTGNLYVKVTPLSTIGTAEAAKVVTVTLAADSVRAVGADGISDTYVVTPVVETFNVTAATTGALTVSAGNDNPAASIVAVASSTTSGVNLLSFNMKAKNSAVIVTDLVATLSTTLANVTDVVSSVKLMKGSTVIKTGSTVGTGTYATTTFSGIDQTIAKDATGSYWISVDLKSDAYPDGTTIAASTTVNGLGWDISDANGDTVSITTNAVGNAHTLTATGITVVKGTATASVQNGLSTKGDIATFTIPFTVTAGDTDVFIYSATPTKIASALTAPTTNTGVNYSTTTSSTWGATAEPTSIFSAANVVTGDVTGAFKVLANTSRTFTFASTIVGSSTVSNGYVGVILKGIPYGPTSSPVSTYYTSGLDSFKTADVYVSLR